jgi:hypothetical protein
MRRFFCLLLVLMSYGLCSEEGKGLRVSIGDLQNAVQAALDAKAVQRLFTEGLFVQSLPDGGMSFAMVPQQISMGAAYIPTEMSVDIDAAGLENLGRLFVLMASIPHAQAEAAMVHQGELAAYGPLQRNRVREEVGKMAYPDIGMRLRFSSPEQARLVEGQIRGVAFAAARPMFSVKIVDGNVLTMRADNAKLMEIAEMGRLDLLKIAAAFGFVDEVDDPHALDLVDHVLAMDLTMRLQRNDDELFFSFGSFEADPAGWLPLQERALMAMTADMTPLTDILRIFQEAYLKRQGSDLDRLAKALDSEQIEDNFLQVLHYAELVGSDTRSDWFREDHALVMRDDQPAPAEAVSLAAAGLASLDDPRFGFRYLSGDKSLADWVKDTLFDFEDRLASREMSASFQGKDEQAAMLLKVQDYLYEELGELRRFVNHEAQGYFLPGYGLFLRPGRPLESLRIIDPDGNEAMRATGLNLPQPMAIGRPRDAAAAEAFLTALSGHMDKVVGGPALQRIDAGDGTRYVLSDAARAYFEPYLAVGGANLEFHLLVKDGLLLIGFDNAFTEEVLTAWNDTTTSALADDIVSKTTISTDAVNGLLADFTQWQRALDPRDDRLQIPGLNRGEITPMRAAIGLIIDLLFLVDSIDYVFTLKDGRLLGTGRFAFAQE